jgi:hypothetical protein
LSSGKTHHGFGKLEKITKFSNWHTSFAQKAKKIVLIMYVGMVHPNKHKLTGPVTTSFFFWPTNAQTSNGRLRTNTRNFSVLKCGAEEDENRNKVTKKVCCFDIINDTFFEIEYIQK